jgi:hypothetical protein
MKTKQEIKEAKGFCDDARGKHDPKLCPLWGKPDSTVLYCAYCNFTTTLAWILEENK